MALLKINNALVKCCSLLSSSPFVILHWWELQGGLQLWVSEFEVLFIFPVFSITSIRLKDHLVFYLFTLWRKRCVAFSFLHFFLFDDGSWTATEECSCHPQCGLISEVKFEQTLEECCRLLKSSLGCCRKLSLKPREWKAEALECGGCQCGRANVFILYKECRGRLQS